MATKEIASMIPLIEGTFSPKEAAELIETVADGRARFHSVQLMRMWEGNYEFDSSYSEKKLSDLNAGKEKVKELISEAREKGYMIEVISNIEVRISDANQTNVHHRL